MSLRSELQEILAQVLPVSPEDAIKGTELIQLIRLRLKHDCSDATLRYNFSMMSADPTAPIAKVDQGQGYYRRPRRNEEARPRQLAALWQAQLEDPRGQHPETLDLELSRWQRLRALALRALLEPGATRHFQFSQDSEQSPARTSLWHYPDLILAESTLSGALTGNPETGTTEPPQPSLARFGLPPWRLRGITLRSRIDHDSCRESFFQALSAANWTHQPALHIGCAIADAQLADELRRLGQEHGVEIHSYGLKLADLDNLPSPEAIPALSEREFEAATAPVRLQILAPGRPRPQLSVEALADLSRHHAEVPSLLQWVNTLDQA